MQHTYEQNKNKYQTQIPPVNRFIFIRELYCTLLHKSKESFLLTEFCSRVHDTDLIDICFLFYHFVELFIVERKVLYIYL